MLFMSNWRIWTNYQVNSWWNRCDIKYITQNVHASCGTFPEDCYEKHCKQLQTINDCKYQLSMRYTYVITRRKNIMIFPILTSKKRRTDIHIQKAKLDSRIGISTKYGEHLTITIYMGHSTFTYKHRSCA